jgi:hypothetical protein
MMHFRYAVDALWRNTRGKTGETIRASKVSDQTFDDWMHGKGDWPTPEQLLSVARAFGKSPSEVSNIHLGLLYAFLRDICKGPGGKFINIEVLPAALPIVADTWVRPIRPMNDIDLSEIRSHIWYDAKLQKTIRGIADPLRSRRIPRIEPPKIKPSES